MASSSEATSGLGEKSESDVDRSPISFKKRKSNTPKSSPLLDQFARSNLALVDKATRLAHCLETIKLADIDGRLMKSDDIRAAINNGINVLQSALSALDYANGQLLKYKQKKEEEAKKEEEEKKESENLKEQHERKMKELQQKHEEEITKLRENYDEQLKEQMTKFREDYKNRMDQEKLNAMETSPPKETPDFTFR